MIRDSRFEIRDSELISNFESRICNRTCFILWLALAAVFSVIPAFAAQQPIEEKVVVTANAYPVPFENLSRAVAVFTREDIDNLPARSIEDILAQAASVDIRSRAPFGMQSRSLRARILLLAGSGPGGRDADQRLADGAS